MSDSMNEKDTQSNETTQGGLGRRHFLKGTGAVAGAVGLGSLLGTSVSAHANTVLQPVLSSGKPSPRRQQTLFGITYETWFDAVGWGTAEAKPLLGYYSSTDAAVITQHAKWLTSAGFDFLLVDWSNNLGGNWSNGTAQKIIAGTNKLFEVFATLPHHPKITLLLGLDNGSVTTANFQAQLDLIKTTYLGNPAYKSMFLNHDDKPLISIFVGPAFANPPAYTNPDFTVRFMGAFHEITLGPGGRWSFFDRIPLVGGPLTPVSDFDTTGLQGWQVEPAWSLTKGSVNETFQGVPVVSYATTQPASGASQQVGTLTSPAFTLSQQVVTFNAIGVDFGARGPVPSTSGRNLFLLKDAATGEILRSAEPPGSGKPYTANVFQMRQWNVSDLVGRRVIFQAVNNSNSGWMGFFGLTQQRNELITIGVATAGNEAPGGFTDWDAHLRNSGGTLVQQVQGIYDFEPELAIIEQWNEFGAPDQYSVAGSNDIEPTVITKFAGQNSDGWGTYYLDLVRKLIQQYRGGAAFPNVQLDTRYP